MLPALLLLGACTGDVEGPPPPGELQAGVARARMLIPLGIGTVGFGPFGVPSNPTPYAEIFPGTDRIHGHPDFTAIAISRGEGHELVFLRTDLAAMYQQLRTAVVEELEERR